MTNTAKLKGKIVENGMTIHDVAKYIGISHAAMSQKINNHSEFKVSEIAKICSLLNIDDKDDIFFVKM